MRVSVLVSTFLVPLALAAASSGCWYRPSQFADRPAVSLLHDDAPVPVPSFRSWNEALLLSDVYLRRVLVEALDPAQFPAAQDVNSLDEVPRSTWFVPSVGAVPLTLQGEPVPPLTLQREAPQASIGGVVVTDSRGIRYELRWDPADRAEMATGAAVVASRLVRAFGLLAPEVWIIDLGPGDITGWAPSPRDDPSQAPVFQESGATLPGVALRSSSELAGPPAFLAQGPLPVQGRYRVSATRWPMGIDLGLAPDMGVRSDDPNDVIPHQDRRTVRALKVLGAWLNIDDLGVRKTRDCYVGLPNRGQVWHFLVGLEDFLGADRIVRTGFGKGLRSDLAGGPALSFISLGLWPGKEPRLTQTRWPSIGSLSDDVDPANYTTPLPYAPVRRLQAPDGYWAAKRIAGIPAETIRVALQAARFSDPSARAELERLLIARRATVVAYWLSQVTPAEVARVQGRVVVFRDGSAELCAARTDQLRYRVAALDERGTAISETREIRLSSSEFAIEIPAPLARRHARVVLRLQSERAGVVAPRACYVHLVVEETAVRVVGVEH